MKKKRDKWYWEKKIKKLLPGPIFPIPRAEEARRAVSKSFHRMVREKCNTKSHYEAVKSFIEASRLMHKYRV